LRRVLITLCVTEITSWGILYYAFPVMLSRLSATTGWSTETAMGAFSTGLVVSALAPSLPLFFAAWVLVGLAQSALLYPPAFSALTRWYGPDRVRALTTLSLVAGLASTVFAPVTAVLVGWLDWRTTYVVLAVVLGAVTFPCTFWDWRFPGPPKNAARPRSGASDAFAKCSATGLSRFWQAPWRWPRSACMPPTSTWCRCSPAGI